MPLAALPAHDEVVLVQCESRLDVSRFEDLLRSGLKGAAQVGKKEGRCDCDGGERTVDSDDTCMLMHRCVCVCVLVLLYVGVRFVTS